MLKKIILATSILASFGAAANTATVYFTGQQDAMCSIQVVKDHAPIFFTDQGSLSIDNYAHVEVSADYTKTLKVSVESAWLDVSAWDGAAPKTYFHTMVEGSAGNSGNGSADYAFTETYRLNGYKAQKVDYFLGVEAEQMITAGAAVLESVVRFECE